jgi:hypothetical protein
MIEYLEDEENNIEQPTPIVERPSFISTITPVQIAMGVGVLILVIILYFLSTNKWALVSTPFFGGFFNNTLFGVQYYFYLVPVAVILYFLAYAYWIFMKWGMMAPFQGLWHALNAGTEVVFVSDLRLNFVLLSEASAKLIFDKERYNKIVMDTTSLFVRFRMWIKPVDQAVSIAKYLQGSWDSKPMTNIGSVPAGILLDAHRWSQLVSPQREAIGKEVDIWNDAHMDDQIHCLSKAWEYMDKELIATPKGVELYVTVPWVRIDNAYPKDRFISASGGFIRQLAENISNGTYDKGGPISMTMAGVVVFIACVFFSGLMFYFHFTKVVPT